MDAKLGGKLRAIADRLDKDAREIKPLLWEICRLAMEKKNCKDIWKLAQKALKHV